MKRIELFALGVTATAAAMCGELTVEPGGKTPVQALMEIRAAKAAGDNGAWTVHVKPGVYQLKESLVFTPADSGTPEAPVTWIGEGEMPVFAGGEPIKGWKDEGGGVWSASIPKTPSGEPAYFEQLWVNGRRADRARVPNRRPDSLKDGYFKILDPHCEAVSNESGSVVGSVETIVVSNSAAAALWQIPDDELPYAQMCVVHKWSFARRVLKKLDRASLKIETHAPKPWRDWQPWNPKETIVAFENVRGGFDAPGEWFYDKKAGKILYRPLPGENMDAASVIAPSSKLSRLVEFKGEPAKGRFVHDITFKNIAVVASDSVDGSGASNAPTQAYQHQAASGYDGAVTAEGAHRIVWEDSAICHTANYGMRFNDGCMSNVVRRCLLDDVGCGGIWMGAKFSHVAEGETLSRRIISKTAPCSTAFNVIEDCTIRNGGRFNPEGSGVAFTHVSDSKILHCDIYDFYYTGVTVGWTWGFTGSVAQRNEIAFNRIYDLGKGVMSDMGGVYTLGTSFGTKVHDNVIHDVWAYSYGGWALYTDEGSEGITMERNLCWNTTDGSFDQHYGTGCVIRNNIFAWNSKVGAVRLSRKAVNDIPCSLNFVNNIVVVREGPLVSKGARGVAGIWAGNLWYDYSGNPVLDQLDWQKWAECGKEVLGKYADPLFLDPFKFDFRLKPESPALAMGFRPWDYSAAGVRTKH